MTEGEPKPAPVEAGADAVIVDCLGKRVIDHDMSDAADVQALDVVADADQQQQVDEPQPVVEPRAPRDRRPRAPILDRSLLTWREDRYQNLFRAVYNGGHPIALIQPQFGPFSLKLKSPGIVLVQDDMGTELDQVLGFDAVSIRDCARRCVCAVLVPEARPSNLYRTAVERLPGGRRHVLLIETCSKRQEAWERVLRAGNPKIKVVVETAAQSEVLT